MVRVRAQVMMRDDSTGGWVPVGGGGLSNVSVQKQKIFHEDEDQLCKHEYLIDGKRISDQAVSIIILDVLMDKIMYKVNCFFTHDYIIPHEPLK